MYRGVFTVGVAVTNTMTPANALTDYSYINARGGNPHRSRPQVARCLTGLGPSGNDANGVLGGWY